MKNLKLGIIGSSQGNGHPYSWSAIFNGYNSEYMKDCPFPVIPQYLSKQTFPQDTIKNANVTHIWTQNKNLSKHIAQASNIEHVVKSYKDLINNVDAILLARDDYQNHYKMSKPFIEAGLPIYIDKPIAITTKEVTNLFALEKYKNQIFTCSALSYAKEFQLSEEDKTKIGIIKHVDAYVMKDWNKYGIHIIEPVLKILTNNIKNFLNYKITKTKIINSKNQKIVAFAWNINLTTTFTTLGKLPSPIIIKLFGTQGNKELIFQDTFYAFKTALQSFINTILQKENCPSKKFVLKTIQTIETGNMNE